jgi:hypothetical protein
MTMMYCMEVVDVAVRSGDDGDSRRQADGSRVSKSCSGVGEEEQGELARGGLVK